MGVPQQLHIWLLYSAATFQHSLHINFRYGYFYKSLLFIFGFG